MDLTGWMEQWNMFPPPGGTILCAVSGGRDSMCLLHYLWALSAQRDFSVAAAHLDHGMRPTATRDEAFVADFCREREIPFHVEHARVYEQAEAWGVSVEEAGRRARYEFLERTARQIGAERIATAHHRDDQAETVLLHLLRGTGTEGLAGIPPVRGKLIRPLLDTPRSEIEAYLSHHGLSYVEDETNEDLRYARNRLRREIWPALEQLHGGARENVARAAAIVRQENAYLNAQAAACLPPEGQALPCRTLLSAPEALRQRILRVYLDRAGCGRKDVGFAHWTALEQLCRTGGSLDLPGGWAAVCREGRLHLMQKAPATGEIVLTPEAPAMWQGCTVCLRPTGEGGLAMSVGTGDTVSLRSWRPGDALTLPGSRGSRTLKRLLADAGVTPERRPAVPVICVNGAAAAVWSVGVDRAYLPGEKDREIEITITERNDEGNGYDA